MARASGASPSFSSSPWIFRARQPFSLASRQMSAFNSSEIGGRPGPGFEMARQYRRNPWRCQRITVSGLTMTRVSYQRDQTRKNQHYRGGPKRRTDRFVGEDVPSFGSPHRALSLEPCLLCRAVTASPRYAAARQPGQSGVAERMQVGRGGRAQDALRFSFVGGCRSREV
jgi:hypothetical protein